MKRQLVIFDFDGTLTRKDSMLEFTRFYWGNTRYLFGMLFLAPMLLFYKIGWIPNWRAKEKFLTHFFRNESVSHFQEACRQFGRQRIPALIRPAALLQLEKHRINGDQLVVVSSSAENWIEAWCRQKDIALIATRLQIQDGRLSGKLEGTNCYGNEKVRRLKMEYKLKDFAGITTYGDSKGDFALFSISSEYYYKPFRR